MSKMLASRPSAPLIAASSLIVMLFVLPATAYEPRIVNGEVTGDYPSTGVLLLYEDSSATSLYGLCSGTLVGCRTFLTAAHCVCPEFTDDATECLREGIEDTALMRVFLPNQGFVEVSGASIAPDYSFAVGADAAVLTLAQPVTGIAPSPINTAEKPALGVQARLVGFGTTRGGRDAADDGGVKRTGLVQTASCPDDIPDAGNVCWEFDGTASNGCSGDSGGPLFIDFGNGPVLAGITSGGNSFDCLAPDIGFDTDVYMNRDWVRSAAAGISTASCVLPAVGSTGTIARTTSGQLIGTSSQARSQIEVPPGTALLRIALNGQLGSGSGFSSISNDFDLYVRAGSAPTTETFDCADRNSTTFGACEFAAPAAGTWHVLVQRRQGSGTYQLTSTMFAATAAACGGDCNRDGAVTIDELLQGVSIALGADVSLCSSFDANTDSNVSIDELIAAVGFALNECPSR